MVQRHRQARSMQYLIGPAIVKLSAIDLGGSNLCSGAQGTSPAFKAKHSIQY